MKAVTFTGNSTVAVNDVPVPDLRSGEVLVRIGASAICGSEMKSYRSPDARAGNPGHEMVGEVVDSGDVSSPARGDRVAVNIITGCGECPHCRNGDRRFCAQQGYVFNGHAEFVAVPAVNCMPMPDELPFDEGVLIGGDTLGVAFHALSKICLRPRDTVAVVGCGPVGLGFVRLLSFYGLRTIAAEVSPYRRELARKIGAESVVDPSAEDGLAAILEAAGGRGVELGIDASGTDAGVNLGLDATRDEGTFIFAGAGHTATINPWSQFLEKEVTAHGVWYFVDRDYHGLLDLYRQGLDVRDLITHRFALDGAPTAYDLFARGETGKVIFEPNGVTS
jgi:threonine dehydrogenase-like Zn-dependent dehydrogenase